MSSLVLTIQLLGYLVFDPYHPIPNILIAVVSYMGLSKTGRLITKMANKGNDNKQMDNKESEVPYFQIFSYKHISL